MDTATTTDAPEPEPVKLRDLAKRLTLTCEYGAKLPYDKQSDWQQNATGYRCQIKYGRRSYTFDFWMGIAHTDAPDLEGCLACLLSDASAGDQTFEDFCRDYGYDEDSRTAERTWKACQRTMVAMQRLLGNEYETFLYAARN